MINYFIGPSELPSFALSLLTFHCFCIFITFITYSSPTLTLVAHNTFSGNPLVSGLPLPQDSKLQKGRNHAYPVDHRCQSWYMGTE